MAAAADRNHVNTSCGDTVKCRLDAGKSPIFRSQSPCPDISVRKSQRVTIFVRIYPYKSLKGLMISVMMTSCPDVEHCQFVFFGFIIEIF